MQTLINNNESFSLELAAQLSELLLLGEFITTAVSKFSEAIEDVEIDIEAVSGDFQLAIHEVCTNTIVHAYKNEYDLPILVTLSLNRSEQQIVAEVTEYGDGYNPKEIGWPPGYCWTAIREIDSTSFILGDVPEQDAEAENGRGIYLLNLLLDSVKYHPQANKNCWTLVKNI